jgi:hypothetical protein
MEQSIEILDSDFVLRRIYEEHIKNDGSLKSNSFSDRNDTPSCHLQRLVAIQTIWGMDGVVCLARLRVGSIRELGLDVVHDPTPEDTSHCLIVKKHSCKNPREKKIRRQLVSISEKYYEANSIPEAATS